MWYWTRTTGFHSLVRLCSRTTLALRLSAALDCSFKTARLDRHAAAGAARRSRDALADAVDQALRRTRQPAVSSAEDWWILSPLHWTGSGCGRRGGCYSPG